MKYYYNKHGYQSNSVILPFNFFKVFVLISGNSQHEYSGYIYIYFETRIPLVIENVWGNPGEN